MNDDCVNNFCCVECHKHSNDNYEPEFDCGCNIAEDLCYDRNRVLAECQYAYEE